MAPGQKTIAGKKEKRRLGRFLFVCPLLEKNKQLLEFLVRNVGHSCVNGVLGKLNGLPLVDPVGYGAHAVAAFHLHKAAIGQFKQDYRRGYRKVLGKMLYSVVRLAPLVKCLHI